ncbi:MAG: hypothetical protein ACFB13_17470 [Kiloniellaceae bacterium]
MMVATDRQPNSDDGTLISSGVLSLLRDCVGARAGERLLIVEEPAGAGYYDDEVAGIAAAAARSYGLRVYRLVAPPGAASAEEMAGFLEGLHGFDHVVFFARIGDQLRFADVSRLPPATMCYTLDAAMLDSAFGAATHRGLCAVKDVIEAAVAAAGTIRVTCPRGTDYTGRLMPVKAAAQAVQSSGDVSLKRFPMLVPRPVPVASFSGRVALSRFLVGTGSQFYDPYWCALPQDVFAVIEGNRLVDLEGDAAAVAVVRDHYRDVAGRFGIDPWYVHSWHAGIHPACAYAGRAQDNMERWSGSAFGNPRILHFHTCGDYAPGEISWNLVDATVTLDGLAVWEAGRLYPERLPGGEALLAAYPDLAALYAAPCAAIGIEG